MKVIGLNRRLAAIMFTDMVGYSALTEGDEALGLELLAEHREVLRNRVAEFGGREVKSTGDGLLIEFPSVVDAVHCAVQVQTALYERNLTVASDRRVKIRIGMHLGDIVDSEKDSHGNGVNIAARIEPFARAGGIAISQSVVDQIGGHVDLPLRKIGRVNLKNIASPPAVYRVCLPWESSWGSRLFARVRRSAVDWREAIRSPARATLGLGLLGAIVLAGHVGNLLWTHRSSVGPTSSHAVLLPERWEIALGEDPAKATGWKPFDPKSPSKFVDEIQGPYLLRLRFPTPEGIAHPAMVLGLVSDRHEAFLNGKFVGGARAFSEVVAYSVGEALNPKGENELLVRAETRPTLTPGLYLLAEAPPQIDEYARLSELLDSHRFSTEVLGSIYLVLCLLIATAQLAYAAFRGRKKFFYSALYLYLGALGVSFYNSFAISSLDFRMYRYLNLLAYAGSAVALASLDFESRGKKKAEALNNAFGLVFAIVSAVLLLGVSQPSALLSRLAILFGAVMIYAAFAAVHAWRPAKGREVADTVGLRVFSTLLVGTTCVICLGKAKAIGLDLPAPSAAFYDFVRKTALVTPLAFAMNAFGVAIADYIRKSVDIAYKRRKDELILGIAAAIARSEDYAETVREVQSRVAGFLGAARSTIYLLDAGGATLRAEYVFGSTTVKTAVELERDPAEGILGYCLKTRAPVWVEDIRRDERFRSEVEARAGDFEPRTYRTGSFVVAPIQIGRKVLGVITIADRIDGRPFSKEDLSLVHLATRDLSVLIGQLAASPAPTRLRKIA